MIKLTGFIHVSCEKPKNGKGCVEQKRKPRKRKCIGGSRGHRLGSQAFRGNGSYLAEIHEGFHGF